jgi:putative transposase
MVNLRGADVQDAAGVEAIIKGVRRRWPWLKHLVAESACDRGRPAGPAAYMDFMLEVVRKLPDQKGCRVLERTLAG